MQSLALIFQWSGGQGTSKRRSAAGQSEAGVLPRPSPTPRLARRGFTVTSDSLGKGPAKILMGL